MIGFGDPMDTPAPILGLLALAGFRVTLHALTSQLGAVLLMGLVFMSKRLVRRGYAAHLKSLR